MKIKADWQTYLQNLRKREIEMIYSGVPAKCFVNGLELGAGDGFQSTLLTTYTQHLFCTDINGRRLTRSSNKDITYQLCDTEYIDHYFEPQSFDLVFSSNLLEHLDKREMVIRKVFGILKDEGACINVVPNSFLKLCWLVFFYPNQIIELAEVTTKPGGLKKVVRKITDIIYHGKFSQLPPEDPMFNNNPKRPPDNCLRGYILPALHGEHSSHLQEFMAYRKMEWVRLIENQGFEVTAVLKMPVTSGYGFGFNNLRSFLEKIGLSSSYAYIAFKKGMGSRFRQYWSK